MRAAVLAFLMLLATAPCGAQDVDTLRVVRVSKLADSYGMTVCFKGVGYSFIKTDVPKDEIHATLVHEAKHREQYTRFANCTALDSAYATTRGKIEIEAEAYAAAYCAIKGGANPIWLFQSYVNRIARLVGTLNRLEIVTTLHRYTGNCAYPGMP